MVRIVREGCVGLSGLGKCKSLCYPGLRSTTRFSPGYHITGFQPSQSDAHGKTRITHTEIPLAAHFGYSSLVNLLECEIFILAGGLSTRMGRDKSRVRLGNQTLLQHIRAAASQLPYPVRIIRRDAVPRCGPIGGIYTALKRSRAESIMLLACDMPLISPSFLKKMIKTFRLAPPAKKSGVKSLSQLAGVPPHPNPMASQAHYESVSPYKTNASRFVVPQWGRGRRNSGEPIGIGSKGHPPAMPIALFARENQLVGFPCLLRRELSLPIVSAQIAVSQFSLQALAKKLRAKTLSPPRTAAHQLININTPADLQKASRRVRS